MSEKTVRGLMFLVAAFTPIIVYLGLGPDGFGVLDAARTEQFFCLYFSLPIAFMMTRKIEGNFFLDACLLIIIASMSSSIIADALHANFSKMADAVAITA